MSNYVNGVGYPIFRILRGVNVIDTINLPLTNKQGLIEEYEEQAIGYEGLDYEESKDIKGYKINFKLYYNDWTKKQTTLDIFKLLYYEKQKWNDAGTLKKHTIILQPRSDIGGRFYEVIGQNGKVNLGLVKSMGNRLIELNYRTKKLISDITPVDPDNVVVVFQNLTVI